MKKIVIIVFFLYFLDIFSKGIVSLAPSITKMLVDLSISNSICATVKIDSFSKGIKVGNFMHINYEKIVEINPDYVFCVGLTQDKIFYKLKKLNVNVIQIKTYSIEDLRKNYTMLGQIFHVEKRAREINEQIDLILKNIKPLHKTYIGILWYSPTITFGENTFQGALLKEMGLINVVGNIKKRYKLLSKETIVLKNPDLFFIFMEKGEKVKKALLRDRAMKKLHFVKNGNIYVIDKYDDFFQPSLNSILFLKSFYEKIKNNLNNKMDR